MMKPPNEPADRQPEPAVPNRLADDLSALFAQDIDVPDDVDRRVLAEARRHFARHRRPRRRLALWLTAAAAAAVLLLAVGPPLVQRLREPSDVDEPRLAAKVHAEKAAQEPARREAKLPRPVAAKEDIDGNGQVDILDAFAVARALKAGRRPEAAWDLNGDGAVDAADIDRIAQAAVDLERGTFQ